MTDVPVARVALIKWMKRNDKTVEDARQLILSLTGKNKLNECSDEELEVIIRRTEEDNGTL